MLMGAHDRAVDHRVFIVGFRRQVLENTAPYTRSAPSAVASVEILPVAEALRKVAPRDASAIAVDHRLDEQSVVCCCHPDVPIPPGKEVADTLPLIVAKAVASHRSAPNWPTSYESKFPTRRNPLNDDTP